MLNEIRQELRRFAETTGIKGVSRIVKTTSKVIRFFWLVSIVVCFVILLVQVSSVFLTYTSHTVTRSSKVVHTKPIFPDVTICNLCPDDNISSESYKKYLKTIETMKNYDIKYNNNKNWQIWEYFRSIVFYNVNTPLLEEIRNNEDGFVVTCLQYGWDLYVPADCKTKGVFTTPLQKCHKIELDWTNGTIAAVSVLLFTNNFQSQIVNGYSPWIRLSTGTGVRVLVHPNGTFPGHKTSIIVSSGNQLSIQLKQTSVNRLQQPYGNCTERKFLIQ